MGDEEMKERESWRLRHVRERLKEEMWVGIVRGGILMWQYLGRLKKISQLHLLVYIIDYRYDDS